MDVPWSRDASVFWQQQLFWTCRVHILCPCCDEYVTMLRQEAPIGFGTFYCYHCRAIFFLGHSMTDWLWKRHDDDSYAVWFHVPCPLRGLLTPDGDKLMRGVWQETSSL